MMVVEDTRVCWKTVETGVAVVTMPTDVTSAAKGEGERNASASQGTRADAYTYELGRVFGHV